ncbi:MAG: hypothetical protein N2248_05045 [candidate division WOR-3 bacterium]|nr:hypothetical protein [candidate division WOR-3 bacterium]
MCPKPLADYLQKTRKQQAPCLMIIIANTIFTIIIITLPHTAGRAGA